MRCFQNPQSWVHAPPFEGRGGGASKEGGFKFEREEGASRLRGGGGGGGDR